MTQGHRPGRKTCVRHHILPTLALRDIRVVTGLLLLLVDAAVFWLGMDTFERTEIVARLGTVSIQPRGATAAYFGP